MFDQFKKISRFKEFTAAVGLNEQELRARGLDGLEAGRKAFQEFNSMITKHTSRSQTSSPQPRADDTSEAATPIDMPATKEWYEHLESAWLEILENNQANYALAENTQSLLDHLMERCTEQTDICQDFQKQCATLPETTKDLQSISETAAALKGKLIQLDREIDEYCKEYEENEFKAWKREQSAKLEQYKSARRATYTEKEQQLQEKYDIHVKDLTSKRRELYEANFQAEIDDYRQRRENQVSSLYKERPRISATTQRLDTLTLESNDSHVLDDFLGKDGMSSENHSKATNTKAREESVTDDDDAPHDLVQADEDYISS
ncbi:hypothetical protein INT43_004731 [Umbelopsis isabellina]|uniref:Uncharacterized protein n=1 Tax=Mortierella isabellina TaxID=91625 RepID=A0A8H7PG63_MORIS|nr:hypothetical protein INT43_004731 [Umbelopsis isabellina]